MEQKPSGENKLSWREAIIEVLKTANKPMSSVEIVAASHFSNICFASHK
jgi:hypothetical protein